MCVCVSPVAAEALHMVLAATLSRGDVALLGAARGRASTQPWGEEKERELCVRTCGHQRAQLAQSEFDPGHLNL